MRPFFPFYGSKWALARHYPPPGEGLVIECFAGSAGYSTHYGARRVLGDVRLVAHGEAHGHAALGEWCRSRRGRVIACEGPGANWLPFTEIGSFKSTRGRAEERVWIK